MLNRLEEISLIARCVAADDRRAFGRLVEEYQEGLRRFLLNLSGGDACLADDLAQETFIKAYTSVRSFKGRSRFKTWLYTIAYREFVTFKRMQHEQTGELAEAQGVADDNSQTDTSDSRHDVDAALSALSDTERSLVLLFYMEDQPIKKIAAITDMPEGTVKVYLARARTKMANFLKNDDYYEQ